MSWAKVLVVDNTLKFQRNFSTFLQMHDYKVIPVGCGNNIKEKVSCEHPDVILIDTVLPKMKRDAIVDQLQQDGLNGSIPIVMFFDGEKSQFDADYKEKQVECLIKSYKLSDLEKKIRLIVSSRPGHDEHRVQTPVQLPLNRLEELSE